MRSARSDRQRLRIALSAVAGLCLGGWPAEAAAAQPNIVFVITDDQGYGDLGCTGNPVIQTPHLDRLAAEASQLTDYHVAPTCSPTRAALLTGHWTNRTGVWHTVNGRSMLRENEVTLGKLLQDHGYVTGMFGKWHLGDNYPYRAEDRGFTEVYRHGGGGVGQTPDLWDNAYFDGHYFHNGQVVAAQGFCTDVFFEQAHRFIRECAERRQPFFAYIAPNAPHGPLHAPQEYLDLYAEQDKAIAAFFGMITNIDDNVGRTRKLLTELGIADNTIFIFTTDNGTATGAGVYNAGMRGAKGSEYDGGHRVPFFCHWPAAGWNRQHVNDMLCHAVDIVPTVLDMVGAPQPDSLRFDGVSLRPLLDPNTTAEWSDRLLVTDSQRVRDPVKWKQTAVMSQDWRLVNGQELYAIKTDPGQRHDVAADHPEQVAHMCSFYDRWWAELAPTFAETTEIHLGHPDHPVVSLGSHDWIQEALPPWNQQHIRQAHGLPATDRTIANTVAQTAQAQPSTVGKSVHEGHWAVKILRSGRYEISVRRWPVEANRAITAGLPAEPGVPGADKAFRTHEGVAIPVVRAVLRVDGQERDSKPVSAADTQITFHAELTAGSHQLAPVFVTNSGDEIGAYYAVVTAVRPNFLIIFTDDHGYGDVSTYHASDVCTPNIDQIARNGMLFTRMRANCTVCSPSRAALLTGRYADRVGVPGVIRTHPEDSWGFFDPSVPTLADHLQQAGYHTALVGKWHLGLESPNTPNERGFDFFHGFLGDMMDSYTTHLRHGHNYLRRNAEAIEPQGHATDLFSDWAADYLRDRAQYPAQPFFLYLAYNAPHFPIEPPEEWLAKVKLRAPHLDEKRARNVAFVEHLDEGIGRVLAALQATGLDRNTLVVFTADNGGSRPHAQNNDPWRDGKQSHYDGGLRVPFMIRWPGHVPPGSHSDYAGLVFDLFPTFLQLAGATPAADLDAVSLVPVLDGRTITDSRDLYFVRREGGRVYGGKSYEALIRGNWKLLQNNPYGPLELYDLQNDPQEKHNLVDAHKAVADELAAALRVHIQRGGRTPFSITP